MLFQNLLQARAIKALLSLLFCYATAFAASTRTEAQLAESKLKHEYILAMHDARAKLISADESKLDECVKVEFPKQLNSLDIAELRKILGAIYRNNLVINTHLKKQMHNLDALFSIEQCAELYKERVNFLKALRHNPQELANTKDNYGWKGKSAFTDIALSCVDEIKKSNFIYTLTKLSGKIFIVNSSENRVEFCGSGMLVPKIEHAQLKFALRTCKHNFKEPQGYEYYFVQSELLDPETGEINTSDAETEADFLRNASNKVIKIDMPHPTLHQLTATPALATPPAVALKTITNRNVTIAELKDSETFVDEIVDYELTAEQISAIDLEHALPRSDYIAIANNYEKDERYYALGYPLYLDLTTPFVITSSCAQPVPDVDNPLAKTHLHRAPTSPGMSGGPVFYFDEASDKIVLIGIIVNGKFDKNYMLTYP